MVYKLNKTKTGFVFLLSLVVAQPARGTSLNDFIIDLPQLLPQYLNGNASLIELTTANRALRTNINEHAAGAIENTKALYELQRLLPNWNVSLEDVDIFNAMAAHRNLTLREMLVQVGVSARSTNQTIAEMYKAFVVVHACEQCLGALEKIGSRRSELEGAFQALNRSPIIPSETVPSQTDPTVPSIRFWTKSIGVCVEERGSIVYCMYLGSVSEIPLSASVVNTRSKTQNLIIRRYLAALSKSPQDLEQFLKNLEIIRRWLALPIPDPEKSDQASDVDE